MMAHKIIIDKIHLRLKNLFLQQLLIKPKMNINNKLLRTK